jgi:tRNA G10  N-methylase Trm11
VTVADTGSDGRADVVLVTADARAGAVRIARTNAPGLRVRRSDARRMPLDDSAVRACVSNLPFGNQYVVPHGMRRWLSDVLAETARVTRPGGRIVLLAPAIPAVPGALTLTGRISIRLLGTKTTIWAYDRR